MAERNRLTREESRAQTRARLLESAAALFAERGFHGTSVEDIAERAGFSRGAFYSNFEHKADLFLALLDDRLAGDLAALEATLAGDD
ncbi:MAG: TetR family transcriptional regulator, partial [Acidimicrobiia bacterium]